MYVCIDTTGRWPDRHLISPDDKDRLFVARWNVLVSILLVDPSIKLEAYQAGQYGVADGQDVYPGNERLARQTGLSERAVREAWHFLRGTEMATRNVRGAWTGDHRTADLYELAIPDDWRGMPVLGPHAGKFTCQQCGKVFNPQPCNTFRVGRVKGNKHPQPVIDPETGRRQVRWHLFNATFCPPPRHGSSCFGDWQAANGRWGGDGAWDMFRKARDDDW